MKLVLIPTQGPRKHHVVTDDVGQYNLGVSFIDAQKLEREIVRVYEQATGKKFPNTRTHEGMTTEEMTGKTAPKCMKKEGKS